MALRYPYVISLLIIIIPLLIYYLRHNTVDFRKKDEEKAYCKNKRFIRIFMFFTRTALFALILVAIASPVTFEEKVVQGETSLQILVDNSSSFGLFNTTPISGMITGIEKYMPVTLTSFGSGDVSAIGDAVLANTHGNDAVLLITDGNNNYGKELGDVLLFLNALNSTVNVIELEPEQTDIAVSVLGPNEVIRNVEAEFVVTLQGVNPVPFHLRVKIDDKVIIDEDKKDLDDVPFSYSFSEGQHKIMAEITVDDHFVQNNVFYKSINVVEKPKVLLYTKENTPMFQLLKEIYDITQASTLPEDLSSFAAIIMNDIGVSDITNEDVDKLTEYVVEGNGLAVIGGNNAFDTYDDSYFETLLPVISGAPAKEQEEEDVNVVVVMDISGSSGESLTLGSGQKKVDMEKALTTQIIEDIREDDKVGVVVFHHIATVISPLTKLEGKKQELLDDIARLKDGGMTRVSEGLKAANDLLIREPGNRNIILISDGITQADDVDDVRSMGETLARQGTHAYTVGIGQQTNALLMKELAAKTGALYFTPQHSERLKLIFGEPDPDESSPLSLRILNSNHFITENIELSAALTGINQVTPKSAARTLVMTKGGDPILNVWRFGLGRVLTLATDDGGQYAAELLTKENSKLISRSVNWLIGDPNRAKAYHVSIDDGNLGDVLDIYVKSDSAVTSEDLDFSKIDEKMYKAEYVPQDIGFFELLNTVAAVNGPTEYQQIGFSEDLKLMVRVSGGEVFKPEQVDEIVEFIKTNAQRVEYEPTYHRWPILAAIIILLLVEILVRRIVENRNTYKPSGR